MGLKQGTVEPLSTKGIVLRPFDDSDIPSFVEAVRESDATVGAWLPWWKADYSEEDARSWFSVCRKGIEDKSSYDIGIFLADGGLLMGGISLNRLDMENRIGSLGYWVRESGQNRGLCTRAVLRIKEFGFGELDLVRLEIVALADNIASRRVAEKCGATLECIAQNRLLHQGKPAPAAIYSFIRS